MAKRSADGDAVAGAAGGAGGAGGAEGAAGPAPSLASTAAPKDLVYLDCASIVPPEFYATHLGSDGTVVFQTQTEIVVANLEGGSVQGRYDPASVCVHGVAEDASGTTALCISLGADLTLLTTAEPSEVIYSRTMPPIVQGGRVAGVGTTVFVIKENAVGVICPFRGEETTWVSPAPVSNLISGRDCEPVIVTGATPDTAVLWTVRAQDMAIARSTSPLPMALSTIAADTRSGVGVVAVYPDTALLTVSAAYPAFPDIPLLVSPVSATWIGQTVYVLGPAAGLGSLPAVYAVMPSLGMITNIFHPDKLCVRKDTGPDAETNCIRGRYVLWDGQPYMLAATE